VLGNRDTVNEFQSKILLGAEEREMSRFDQTA
jgi:hypothetical protein